jgi:hypothetical protein
MSTENDADKAAFAVLYAQVLGLDTSELAAQVLVCPPAPSSLVGDRDHLIRQISMLQSRMAAEAQIVQSL